MIGPLRVFLNVVNRPDQPGDLKVAPYLVDRFQGLRVEVFSNEHPPPHFRVKCGSETASYQIKNCAPLNGELRRYYRVINSWHAENKAKLIEAWNSRRTTDCPVGAYRED